MLTKKNLKIFPLHLWCFSIKKSEFLWAKSFKNEKEKLKHEIEQKQRQFNDLIEKVTEKSIQNESFSKEISIKQTKLEELAEKVDSSV